MMQQLRYTCVGQNLFGMHCFKIIKYYLSLYNNITFPTSLTLVDGSDRLPQNVGR